MQTNQVEMSVVIHGQNKTHDAREFTSPQDRQRYIEGRPGSEFSIRLRNNSAGTVLAILAVDGLSVLDGKEAGEQSPGYVLKAGETIDVPGWVVDGNTAAKFFFATQEKGYSAAVGKGVANTGVIALKAFREKARVSHTAFRSSGALLARRSGVGGQSILGSSYGSISKGLSSRSMSGRAETFGAAASLASFNATDSGLMASASVSDTVIGSTEEQKLSTGFGDATEFKTTKTDFERGDLLAMMVLWYRDERGLRNVGIDPRPPVTEQRANPFPADSTGCAVPEGWSR